jgi:DNA-binding NtrC family response regulator
VAPRPIDVRFVAATNQPLEALVAGGQFRRDLYFRLAGITISIPPLRARAIEIPILARRFLEEACQRTGRSDFRFSNAAMAKLRAHDWPGNIRELKNVIERAVVLCPSQVIERDHLVLSNLQPSGARAEDPERQRIIDALEEAGGNQTRAARLLGISRRTLVNKLDRFELPRPRKPS